MRYGRVAPCRNSNQNDNFIYTKIKKERHSKNSNPKKFINRKSFSEMITEINKVEGFNPMEYARTIKDTDKNDLLYLDIQYRKLWFCLVNPNGKIDFIK